MDGAGGGLDPNFGKSPRAIKVCPPPRPFIFKGAAFWRPPPLKSSPLAKKLKYSQSVEPRSLEIMSTKHFTKIIYLPSTLHQFAHKVKLLTFKGRSGGTASLVVPFQFCTKCNANNRSFEGHLKSEFTTVCLFSQSATAKGGRGFAYQWQRDEVQRTSTKLGQAHRKPGGTVGNQR